MARKATSTNVPHIPLGKRKRVLAASLASTDNVDPLAIKRRKHEAANASASAASAAASPAAATQQDPTVDELRNPSPNKHLDTADNIHQPDSDDDSDFVMYMHEKTADPEEQKKPVEVEETDEDILIKSYIIPDS